MQLVFALLSRPTMRFGRLFDEEFLNLVLPVGVSDQTQLTFAMDSNSFLFSLLLSVQSL